MNTIFKFQHKFSFKKALLTSLLAISLPVASVAHADQGDDNRPSCSHGNITPHDMHSGKPPYLRGLNLTTEQEDQLFKLNYAQMPMVREQHKQRQQLMEELHATVQADKFDDVKIQQLADKAAKLEKEEVLARARHEAKTFALLTPEQRKKAREFKVDERGFGHRDEPRGRGDDDKRPIHFKHHHKLFENRTM